AVIAIIKTTGLFSLAPGQIASSHVVNTGEERGFVVNWRALDGEGNLLARSERRHVALGQASSFDFGPVELAPGPRMALRVVLTVEGVRGHNNPGFVATEEAFDSDTGKTALTVSFEDCACGAQ